MSKKNDPKPHAKWLDAKVCQYESVTKATGKGELATVDCVLERIRSDSALARKVTKAREIFKTQGKGAYGKWRQTNIAAFAMSGVGTRGKGASTLGQHSGLLQLDIDEDANPRLAEPGALNELRSQLKRDPHIAFLFISLSGKGLKGAVRIDVSQHRESFAALNEYIHSNYSVRIDQMVKDQMRLCFLSSDPDLFVNELAIELPVSALASNAPISFISTVTQEDSEDSGRHKKTNDGERGQEKERLSELYEAARKWACRERNTANRKAFGLAREVVGCEKAINRKLTADEFRTVFNLWYRHSFPSLDPEKNRDNYYCAFIEKTGKVRVPIGAGDILKRATKRASELPLPELPGASENMLKVLALHRELQRESGDASHFLSCRVAQKFAGLKHHTEAHRIQKLLASPRFEALQIVKNGRPRKAKTEGLQERGESTEWRYLLPIPPLQAVPAAIFSPSPEQRAA